MMHRIKPYAVAAILVALAEGGVEVASQAMAQPTAAVPSSQPSGLETSRAEATDARLATAVEGGLSIKGESLESVLDDLARKHGLAMVIRWDALQAAGVRRTTPVHLALRPGENKPLPLREILRQVIRPGALDVKIPDPNMVPTRSVQDNGEILITTRKDLFASFAPERTYRLQSAHTVAGPERMRSVAEMIKVTVASDSWRDDGGGTIRIDGDTLVIRQAEESHRKISGIMDRLQPRALNEGAAAAPMPPPAPPLDQNVGPMSFKGAPLGDVFVALRRATGQSIFVHWKSLEPHRITRSLPVTIDLSNLQLQEALDRLLEAVGGKYVRLGHATSEGVVTVTTAAELSMDTSTRTYDIRRAIPDEQDRAAAVEAIKNRVRGLDPLSWRDAGGTVGSLSEVGGTLVVTHVPAMHEKIAFELRDVLPAQQQVGKGAD